MPTSHGSSDAFSTGSQAQNPPQPSTWYDHQAPSTMPTVRKVQASKRPAPGLALPVLVEPSGDQRGDGEGEGQGEPDQPEVEHRRVEEHERIVLQQHVRPEAVRRDRARHVREGVGGPEHQREEERRDHVDDERRPGDQAVVRPAPEPPDHRGRVAAEDHAPRAGSIRRAPTTSR